MSMGDARFDAVVSAAEHPDGRASTPEAMKAEHDFWVTAGLLDPDEPTPWSHYVYQQRLTRPFTRQERAEIRVRLGLRGQHDAVD